MSQGKLTKCFIYRHRNNLKLKEQRFKIRNGLFRSWLTYKLWGEEETRVSIRATSVKLPTKFGHDNLMNVINFKHIMFILNKYFCSLNSNQGCYTKPKSNNFCRTQIFVKTNESLNLEKYKIENKFQRWQEH